MLHLKSRIVLYHLSDPLAKKERNRLVQFERIALTDQGVVSTENAKGNFRELGNDHDNATKQ